MGRHRWRAPVFAGERRVTWGAGGPDVSVFGGRGRQHVRVVYGSVPGMLALIPLVVSGGEMLVNETVIGGEHAGWNVAVAVRLKSALPFCTGKSPAAVTLV